MLLTVMGWRGEHFLEAVFGTIREQFVLLNSLLRLAAELIL